MKKLGMLERDPPSVEGSGGVCVDGATALVFAAFLLDVGLDVGCVVDGLPSA
jgi:hypothetical protein